ncbi:hypothetical protein [Amnibacterium kyonggiense]|uniref:Dolichyl-phosphate-mannose-protein mannosyltransferase n=1 Tax=Amnibacterium kyonggiense TaxID=595671 RepID=A0A4R7FKN7_9MICO|nr:hypothetical protein [Amnibacterium kyonggiense]TDS76915.1 hypothetical protein CLV52_1854 [Amnibacterium kyonggiense]
MTSEGGPVSRRGRVALVGGVAAVAFALRLHMELHGGGLLGINAYDDGVHLSSAAAMVHGRVPYRDFLFLQPPGMLLAASPFALLARLLGDPVALAAFRVAFELVGAASAAMVVVVLRPFGFAAALAGGLCYAVFAPAVYDERTALLEPAGTLAVLGALALLPRATRTGRGAALGVGALLGVAIDFKGWYVVAALVILLAARGARLRVLIGLVVAVGVVMLPFFALAPQQFVAQVALAQLGRPRFVGATPVVRLASMLGVTGIHSRTPIPGVPPALALAVALAGTLAATVLAAIDRRSRVFVALGAADLVVALLAPSWFPHYASLTAPLLALVVGVAVGALAGRLRSRAARPILVGVVVVGLVGANAAHDLVRVDVRPPGAALRAAAARIPGCIVADDPTILLVMDVLTRDLDRGCPLRPDVSGYSYGPDAVRVAGVPLARTGNARYQAGVVRYLRSGDAVIRVRSATRLNAASVAEVDRGPVLFRSGRYVIRSTAP